MRPHPPALCWLAAVAAFAAFALQGCLCQMTQPLQGQGLPPDVNTTVHVTALLERLLSVDEKNYRFEAIVYIYLSWEDDRAAEAVRVATEEYANGTRESCELACDRTGTKLSRENAGIMNFCCDDIWLPNVNIMNAYDLPEGRIETSGNVILDGAVAWFVAIQCNFFTPMNFQNFPFDTQELVMQFRQPAELSTYMSVNEYVPSATSTRYLIEGKGDIVSGWSVNDLEIRASKRNAQDLLDFFIGNYGKPSGPNDPLPLTTLARAVDDSEFALTSIDGFDVVVTVERFWTYFIINMYVPILLIAIISFVTYVIPPLYLEARVALNVTLFLSLTALQFVINDQLPRSSYPTTVTLLIVVCYVIVTLAIPESIVVYKLAKKWDKLKLKDREIIDEPSQSPSGRSVSTLEGSGVDVQGVKRQRTSDRMLRRFHTMRKKQPLRLAWWIDITTMMVMFVVIFIATMIFCVRRV